MWQCLVWSIPNFGVFVPVLRVLNGTKIHSMTLSCSMVPKLFVYCKEELFVCVYMYVRGPGKKKGGGGVIRVGALDGGGEGKKTIDV